MNPFEQLALAWMGLARGIRMVRVPSVLAAAMILASVQCVLVLALAFAAHPLLAGTLGVVLGNFSPDALRYPRHFERLAEWARWTSSAVQLLVAPMVAAHVMRVTLARAEHVSVPGGSIGDRLREAPALVLAALPGAAMAWLVWMAPDAISGVRLSSLVRGAFALACAGAGFMILAWWAPAVALVALERVRPHVAWRESLGTWTTLGVALPAAMLLPTLLLSVPMQSAAHATGVWMQRGWPEGIVVVLLLDAAVMALVTVMHAGAVALLVAARPREGDEV